MAHDDERVVAIAELSSEDHTALGWAVTTSHSLGTILVERIRRDGHGVTVAELGAIRRDWERAGRLAPEHHVHRTGVCFEDGTVVTGVTFTADDPYGRVATPSFGVYLDERWNPPWRHVQVAWPDFGEPSDLDALRTALVQLIERAREGDIVEIGCLGGHGRTGTALACVAVLTGTRPADAVAWVRANYCARAVETLAQEALVRSFLLRS